MKRCDECRWWIGESVMTYYRQCEAPVPIQVLPFGVHATYERRYTANCAGDQCQTFEPKPEVQNETTTSEEIPKTTATTATKI